MAEAPAYREGTTHVCLVKVHHSYYTIVHIAGLFGKRCGSCDQNREDASHILYEVINTDHGLLSAGFACCSEQAFQEAWETIVQHMASSDAASRPS